MTTDERKQLDDILTNLKSLEEFVREKFAQPWKGMLTSNLFILIRKVEALLGESTE